jgi:quercetin dioxygenase-like cupin family protein
MPVLIQSKEMKTEHRGADSRTIGTAAMVARRWTFEPGAHGPELTHGPVEQLLYVIRGSGAAVVNGERLPLNVETVLWLEPGDRYHLEADDSGLEILQGYAPVESS